MPNNIFLDHFAMANNTNKLIKIYHRVLNKSCIKEGIIVDIKK